MAAGVAVVESVSRLMACGPLVTVYLLLSRPVVELPCGGVGGLLGGCGAEIRGMQGTAGTAVGDHYADRGGRRLQRELLGVPLVVELSVTSWASANALVVLTPER